MNPLSNTPAKVTVAAVMATMNRSATAMGCVRALAMQSRPPERVIVADNVSEDGTVKDLGQMPDPPFELTIHRMSRNRGNAGGVEEAMEIAFAGGADLVWVLDDDSWPRPKALEAMLGSGLPAGVVRHAIQVFPNSQRLTWPMSVRSQSNKWKLAWTLGDLPPGEFIPTRASWTGALISKEIHAQVGPVNGELFIRGEDEEYPWRIGQAGFTFEAATEAIMDHPGPPKMHRWNFLGRSLFLEKGLPDSKLYYKVRNMVWLRERQAGRLEAMLMALAYIGGITVLDGPSRLPLLRRAVHHAFQERLGPMT